MFTQKLSMDCTKEQYEKYLKAELEKMGYKESLARWGDDVIVNNYSSENGLVGNPSRISNKLDNSRTYLGKFNAPLFLALAAMTDRVEGGYKEKITDGQGNWASLSPFGYCTIINGDGADRYAKWRKATVSEIMAKFGEQPQKVFIGMCGKYTFDLDFPNIACCPLNDSKLDIEKAQEQLEKEGKEYFSKIANRESNNSKAISEIAKSWNSLMDAMDEYHIESLKSKGYRIFKQTTTLEEV